MRINLDLPKYKWDDIYNHLKKHIDESENVAALCTAIKLGKYEKSINHKIYTFLYSNGFNNQNINFIKKIKIKNKINVNLDNDKLFQVRIK